MAVEGPASDAPREEPAHLLPALTTENRTEWAFVRERHFSRGVNRASLDVIERAQFVVHLDDASPADWSGLPCRKAMACVTPDLDRT